jgi:polar amino acid transport system substrate-binding protein
VAARLRPAPSLRRVGADQSDVGKMPGAVILSGQFAAVQQAVGTTKAKVAAAAWVRAFVEEAKASGLVARFIEQFKVQGLSVAPLG